MAKDMLTPEARAKFEQAIQNDPQNQPAAELTPEAKQQALDQGAKDAQADVAAATGADAPAPTEPAQPAQPPQEPAPDPNAALVASVGFKSVQELVDAFTQLSKESAAANDALKQLTAFKEAAGNEDDLDPKDPNYAVLKAVKDKFAPALEYLSAETKNRMVQKAWSEAAKDMPDLDELNPEIAAYFSKHPELSVQDDGLSRAYHEVRSGKYKNETQLLSDPEFQKKIAGNDAVKKMVIEAYLADIQRNGERVPPTINNGGGIPLTGARAKPKTMDEAKKMLEQALRQS